MESNKTVKVFLSGGMTAWRCVMANQTGQAPGSWFSLYLAVVSSMFGTCFSRVYTTSNSTTLCPCL